jgi:hypothetical protein
VLEVSVAPKANNTRARVDTKCAVVVFCTEKSAEKKMMTNFLSFESQKNVREEM